MTHSVQQHLRLEALQAAGIEVARRTPLEAPPNSHNRAYLRTKKHKSKHLLKLD